jgi:hypothetical protein
MVTALLVWLVLAVLFAVAIGDATRLGGPDVGGDVGQ